MSNLNTVGTHLSDFWPYVAKIGKLTIIQVWALKMFLRVSYIILSQFVDGFLFEIC